MVDGRLWDVRGRTRAHRPVSAEGLQSASRHETSIVFLALPGRASCSAGLSWTGRTSPSKASLPIRSGLPAAPGPIALSTRSRKDPGAASIAMAATAGPPTAALSAAIAVLCATAPAPSRPSPAPTTSRDPISARRSQQGSKRVPHTARSQDRCAAPLPPSRIEPHDSAATPCSCWPAP